MKSSNKEMKFNEFGFGFITDDKLTALAHKDDKETGNKGLPSAIKVVEVYTNNNDFIHYLVYDYSRYVPLYSSREINDVVTWIYNKINHIVPEKTVVVKEPVKEDIVEELFNDDEDDYYYGILYNA